MLHRCCVDGAWARAIFGSGGFILWGAGITLGVLSSIQTGFLPLPPSLPLVLALVALGLLDAGAGFLAWLTIALLSIFTGNITGFDDVCTLMGMFTLFAALMTLNRIRPLRRERSSEKFLFDRAMDYIIPTIYLLIAASAVLDVINGLSGLVLFVPENYMLIRVVAVLALWGRLVLEDITTAYFPIRYERVHAGSQVRQNKSFIFVAFLIYIIAYMMVAIPFFGFGSMLLILLALDIIPSFLSFIKQHLPNSKFLHKWYPGTDSTYASLVLTVIGVYLAFWLLKGASDYRQMSTIMVILAIPYAVAEIPSLFGREGNEPKNGWANRFASVICWIFFALISLDVIRLL